MRDVPILILAGLLTVSGAHAESGTVEIGQTDWCASPNPEDHLAIYIKGPAAAVLLNSVKPNGPDESFARIGLTVYFSGDGLISCDVTDPANLGCSIGFDRKASKVEPVAFCE